MVDLTQLAASKLRQVMASLLGMSEFLLMTFENPVGGFDSFRVPPADETLFEVAFAVVAAAAFRNAAGERDERSSRTGALVGPIAAIVPQVVDFDLVDGAGG